MKISRMKKGEWSKIRAFFDLETDEGFNIKGFKLIEGIEGMFVGFPSQQNKDGEYKDTIFADKTLKQQVNKLALDFYSNDKSNDSDVPF